MWHVADMVGLALAATFVWPVLGWVLAGACAICLAGMFRAYLFPRNVIDIDASSFGDRPWPTVVVIVPARDEAATIRPALASLLALDYDPLKIIAVDDRSTDRTGQILDELAADNDRLDVMHVTELPAGWLGKNHANWVGAAQSDSDWLLFTDADVVFEPDVLERAVCFAERNDLDHLALVPELIRGGLWENAMVGTFLLFFMLQYRPWSVRNPRSRRYVGIGAFNLIRRSAYERIGTHRRLALDVTDDVKLGKLVKLEGLTQDVLNGDGQLAVRWHHGLRGVIRGLEKNAFAGFDYSLAWLAGCTVPLLLGIVLMYAGAAAAPGLDRAGYLAAAAMVHLAFAILLWRGRVNPALTVLLPVMGLVFYYIIYRATYLTLHRGGIVWRGTLYPLSDLRKGVV